ncbi:MAG: carbohydrate kinase family protein [Candidatus Doudnabacteria bacterium]|nr:carbohydrate kinase family protein [Candidatus Doudnabacteria bacterium]
MSTRLFDVVAIGDCKADHFIALDNCSVVTRPGGIKKLLLDFGQKIPVREFKFFPGGNALNTAVSFSRLGLKTALLTVLGHDDEGARILAKLASERISRRFVRIEKGVETDKSIILVFGGERTVLSYHAEKTYHLPADSRTIWVYLTSLGAEYKKIYEDVAKKKNVHGLKISYNPGTRQLLHSVSAVRKMARASEIFIVNLQEARLVAGRKSANPKSLLIALKKFSSAITVITDGPKGAFAQGQGEYYRIASFPAKRIDSTGAGDAFASAFTAAIIYGKGPSEALRWGSLNAVGEIKQIGVQTGLPTKTQMLKLLKSASWFSAKKF